MSFGSLVFTPTITRLQEQHGSRRQNARMERSASVPQALGPGEREFIGERDRFNWATTGETGWPYIQHRGGPPGFLKVIDDRTLALADFRGNKQYISTGNLAINSKVADGRPACWQMGFCISGCAIDAKWTSANSEIPRALATDCFELRPDSMVQRIAHDKQGKVTSVLYRDKNGTLHPNVAGHAVYGDRIAASLTPALYDDGDLSKPRPPAE